MMIDIDYFKRYNDTFGHPAGDDALRLVGDALRNSVRAEDLACRKEGGPCLEEEKKNETSRCAVDCDRAARSRFDGSCRRLLQRKYPAILLA